MKILAARPSGISAHKAAESVCRQSEKLDPVFVRLLLQNELRDAPAKLSEGARRAAMCR